MMHCGLFSFLYAKMDVFREGALEKVMNVILKKKNTRIG
jgi:hypothetical protein